MSQPHQMIKAQKESDLVILAGITCNDTFRFGLDLPDHVISVNRSPQQGTLVMMFCCSSKLLLVKMHVNFNEV